MTTRIIIKNEDSSNGDVVVQGRSTSWSSKDLPATLFPGESLDLWITTSTFLFITETWPTNKPKPQEIDVSETKNSF